MTWNEYLELLISQGISLEHAQNNIGHLMDLYGVYDWDAEVPFEVR